MEYVYRKVLNFLAHTRLGSIFSTAISPFLSNPGDFDGSKEPNFFRNRFNFFVPFIASGFFASCLLFIHLQFFYHFTPDTQNFDINEIKLITGKFQLFLSGTIITIVIGTLIYYISAGFFLSRYSFSKICKIFAEEAKFPNIRYYLQRVSASFIWVGVVLSLFSIMIVQFDPKDIVNVQHIQIKIYDFIIDPRYIFNPAFIAVIIAIEAIKRMLQNNEKVEISILYRNRFVNLCATIWKWGFLFVFAIGSANALAIAASIIESSFSNLAY